MPDVPLSGSNWIATFKMVKILRSMKILSKVIIGVLILIGGCAAPISKYQINTVSIDLSNYSKEDFFISTGDYYGAFYPVSVITVTCKSGYVSNNGIIIQSEVEDTYRQKSISPVKECDTKTLLDQLIINAKNSNADGLINMKFYSETVFINGGPVILSKASGLAIIRKSNKIVEE